MALPCWHIEYLAPNKLSTEDVDDSYFEKAYQVLQNHPKVQGTDWLCLDYHLELQSHSPQCCICISGSHGIPVDKSLFEIFEEIIK
ncbi:hypothetical protein IRJ41_020241 [Triplophysa rosa]|uniref:Uncharacterized protein n=1 Tax=Triplophysa rosa TaxID=992332 RepID=A0A9W7T3E5_TRIRA|nr:hypothetical protein IRJ41_020241 [Triplophysa rosa]